MLFVDQVLLRRNPVVGVLTVLIDLRDTVLEFIVLFFVIWNWLAFHRPLKCRICRITWFRQFRIVLGFVISVDVFAHEAKVVGIFRAQVLSVTLSLALRPGAEEGNEEEPAKVNASHGHDAMGYRKNVEDC